MKMTSSKTPENKETDTFCKGKTMRSNVSGECGFCFSQRSTDLGWWWIKASHNVCLSYWQTSSAPRWTQTTEERWSCLMVTRMLRPRHASNSCQTVQQIFSLRKHRSSVYLYNMSGVEITLKVQTGWCFFCKSGISEKKLQKAPASETCFHLPTLKRFPVWTLHALPPSDPPSFGAETWMCVSPETTAKLFFSPLTCFSVPLSTSVFIYPACIVHPAACACPGGSTLLEE